VGRVLVPDIGEYTGRNPDRERASVHESEVSATDLSDRTGAADAVKHRQRIGGVGRCIREWLIELVQCAKSIDAREDRLLVYGGQVFLGIPQRALQKGDLGIE
jgi:hypothetical protein